MSDSPHRPTLFIDRNSGGRKFRDLITKAGIPVVLHDEHFRDQKTPDKVWVKEIGELGWIMVTGDGATIRSLLFLQALARSKACVFFLNALNGATPEGKAECIVNAYAQMLKICSEREKPLFWRFNKGGEVVVVNFREKLGAGAEIRKNVPCPPVPRRRNSFPRRAKPLFWALGVQSYHGGVLRNRRLSRLVSFSLDIFEARVSLGAYA